MRNILFSFLLLSNLGYSQLFKTDAPKFAMFLDGVDEHININSTLTPLSSTTKGTWSMWAKPVDATPASLEIFISFGDADAGQNVQFYIGTAGKLLAQVASGGAAQWRVSTDVAAFSDNVFTHIALVQDGVSPVLYVDGVAVAQTFSISTDKTQWFSVLGGLDNGRIGDVNFNNNGESEHFNGNTDEVLFINTNLSASQITTLRNSGKPKNESGISGGITYLRMGENASFSANWTFVDQISSNNGTSVNMTLEDRVISTLIYEFPGRLISSGNNLLKQ